MRRIVGFMLASLILLLAGCSSSRSQIETKPHYQSYKDIPGVTPEEITAVESLLSERSTFIYGVGRSTEAFVLEDGSFGGFAALFSSRLAELFGFEVELISYDWEEMNEKILSHEIDFSGDFTPTPARLQELLMTDPIVQRTINIFTNVNSLSLAEIEQTRPIRCAFLEGSMTYSLVKDTFPMNYEPVFVINQSFIPEMLQSGEIDVFIEENPLEAAYDTYDFIRTEEYYPLSYSPVALATGNRELAPIINIVQKYLKNGGSYEVTELYNQGYRDYMKRKLSNFLSAEELAYLREHTSQNIPIPAAFEVDNYPISFYNQNEKEFQGVAVDVLKEVTELTGLQFSFDDNMNSTWADLLGGLESGKYSIISELLQTPNREGRFLWASKPYSTDKYAMLSRADFPDVDINQILFAKVGLVEGSAYSDLFRAWFPDSVNTVEFAHNADAFLALERGDIDLLMATHNTLLNLTNYQEKPSFKINTAFNYSSDSYFGFNKNEVLLRSIVDKALEFIDTEQISDHWNRKVFDYQSKLIKDMFPYFIAFIVLAVIAFLVVYILLLKNRNMNKHLGELVRERTAELSLQTSTLRSIFESIPDLIFCKDMNMNYTQYNKSFADYFGFNIDELIGKNENTGLNMPIEQAEQIWRGEMDIIKAGELVRLEENIPSITGTARLFETIKTPLMEDGEPIGMIAIARDITERKAAEETIKLMLDNLDTCIYITEIESGSILFINERMEQEFGCDDLTGEICWKVLQNGFAERCEFCPVPKLMESGEDYYIWEEHNTVTGKYYKNSDSLIRWHDGRLVHMQHSVDITDIKQAQTALDKRLKQQSIMAQISQSFLSDTDINYLINDALRMIGEFLGTAQILFHRLDEDGVTLICENEWFDPVYDLKSRIGWTMALQDPLLSVVLRVIKGEDIVLSSNDPYMKKVMAPYRVNFENYITMPIFLNKNLYGALDFSRVDDGRDWSDSDISLVKLFSNVLIGALERHHMESQLISAKEQAEQGSRAKSDFLSRMSHEIRTPMNAVIGMVSIAKDSNDLKKINDCLDMVDSAAKQLLGIINDILDMSKIEADKFELDIREFDFEAMLINVSNVTSFRADEKKQNFVVNLNKNVPMYMIGDELRLSQVITNLLSNAVKFTPEHGTILLNIDRTAERGDDLILRVEVADTGIGITKEQQARLFTSFEQADGGVARKFGGTGLGLAISKRIVELMGGRIWIESEPGGGSRFIFTIKIKRGSDKGRDKTKLAHTISRENLRILAVDDSPEVRKYFTYVMESLNLPCDVAASGSEALSMIRNGTDKPYNMFFIDWQMPEMNGIELTKKIKQECGENSVVFMISVAEWSHMEDEALAAGVKSFVSKPLFPSTLINAINECLAIPQIEESEETDTAGIDQISFAGHTILIAEDVNVNRIIMSAILEKTGVSIEYAENGEIAVNMFKDAPEKYSLILMDIHMPEMDGYDATRIIRSLEGGIRSTKIPIIAMTANVFREDIEACMAVGMNDHVGKPIDPEVLIKTMNKYIKR